MFVNLHRSKNLQLFLPIKGHLPVEMWLVLVLGPYFFLKVLGVKIQNEPSVRHCSAKYTRHSRQRLTIIVSSTFSYSWWSGLGAPNPLECDSMPIEVSDLFPPKLPQTQWVPAGERACVRQWWPCGAHHPARRYWKGCAALSQPNKCAGSAGLNGGGGWRNGETINRWDHIIPTNRWQHEQQCFTQRDSIGPDDVVSDQAAAVASVQTCSLDLRRIPPVCPINEAGRKKMYGLNRVKCGINTFSSVCGSMKRLFRQLIHTFSASCGFK